MTTKPGPELVDVNFDPITRIVGSLGLYTKIDFANRRVADCKSTSSIFRGYSLFMQGKDPRDAHFITSRICGICACAHSLTSIQGAEEALGLIPSAQTIALRDRKSTRLNSSHR